MGLKEKNKDFAYLGENFQKGLITQLLTDRIFANSIIDIIDPNYFNNKWLRLIMSIILNNYEEYEVVPDIKSLEIILLNKTETLDEHQKVYLTEILREIKEHDLYNSIMYQDLAMKFCKTQEMQKSINKVQKVIDTGDLDRFFECESIVRDALEKGDNKDNAISIDNNIDDVLSDDFRNPIPTGIDGLDEIMNGGLSRQELGVILAPFGVGKSQPLTSKILTPDGWKLMGDINVGDDVISRNGKPTKVIGVYPQGIRPIYKVSFNDGTETKCDEEHLWLVNTINQRNITIKTSEMIGKVKINDDYNYQIPIIEPIHFNETELFIDPYELGTLLGNNNLLNRIIPKEYLYNSVENRTSLLQGLVDSVGEIKSYKIEIPTNSLLISENIKELILSLGGRVSIMKKDSIYITSFTLPNNGIKPFRNKSEINNIINDERFIEHSTNKMITNIEYHNEEEAQCIMVDNPEHLYVTDDYIVTHNTTMITKIGNSAKNSGYNVLQIFFEDTEKVIQRKHFSCWSGVNLNDLSIDKENIKKIVAEKVNEPGELKLKKFSSDGVTIPMIKQYIRKLIASGFRPDIVLLDYIDVVSPSKRYDDANIGEGKVMREFESMLADLNLAGWTAVQGNRCVLLSTEVQTVRLGKCEIKDVIKGDKILTHKGYKKVTHVFPISKQPVYKIKLKSGKSITVSKKHKFPTNDGRFLSIKDGLNIGDKLLTKKQ